MMQRQLRNISGDSVTKLRPASTIEQQASNNGDVKDEKLKSNAELVELREDLARRQESYIRRERQYKTQIEELEKQVKKLKGEQVSTLHNDVNMDKIRSMHKTIIANVAQVQERTASILQEQERDLLRAFRARLFEVQSELEKEKNTIDDGASAWREKNKLLEAEVDWAKEMADRLDRLNQSLTRENQRLKNQFSTQENDREFLVKQLVSIKKDNARLRAEYETMKNQNEVLNQKLVNASSQETRKPVQTSMSTAALPRPNPGESLNRASSARPYSEQSQEADNRYKEIIKRLKRLLEVERRNLRQVRAAYTSELGDRTELEIFLKKCIDDVKGEIATKKANRNPTTKFEKNSPAKSGVNIKLEELDEPERKRVMELLLSQERVINLLYGKTFPAKRFVSVEATMGDPPDDYNTISDDMLIESDTSKIFSDSNAESGNKLIV